MSLGALASGHAEGRLLSSCLAAASLLRSSSRCCADSSWLCLPTTRFQDRGSAAHSHLRDLGFKDTPGGDGGGDADDIMAFVRKKASADWRRLSVSLPFAHGELTASLASAVKEIRDQTSPDSTGARLPSATAHHVMQRIDCPLCLDVSHNSRLQSVCSAKHSALLPSFLARLLAICQASSACVGMPYQGCRPLARLYMAPLPGNAC